MHVAKWYAALVLVLAAVLFHTCPSLDAKAVVNQFEKYTDLRERTLTVAADGQKRPAPGEYRYVGQITAILGVVSTALDVAGNLSALISGGNTNDESEQMALLNIAVTDMNNNLNGAISQLQANLDILNTAVIVQTEMLQEVADLDLKIVLKDLYDEKDKLRSLELKRESYLLHEDDFAALEMKTMCRQFPPELIFDWFHRKVARKEPFGSMRTLLVDELVKRFGAH